MNNKTPHFDFALRSISSLSWPLGSPLTVVCPVSLYTGTTSTSIFGYKKNPKAVTLLLTRSPPWYLAFRRPRLLKPDFSSGPQKNNALFPPRVIGDAHVTTSHFFSPMSQIRHMSFSRPSLSSLSSRNSKQRGRRHARQQSPPSPCHRPAAHAKKMCE